MPSTKILLYYKESGEPQEFSTVDAEEALRSGAYLRQPPAESSPLRAYHTPAPETPAGRLQAVQARMRTAQTRVRILREKAATDDMLSDDESVELLSLEAKVQHMHPVLARLDAEARQAAYKVDVQIVKEEWADAIVEKVAAHQAVVAKVQELKVAIEALAVVHQNQEDCLAILPRDLLTRLNFPSFSELLRNMASRMPAPMGWSEVWCGPAGFVLPAPDALLGIDPGTKMLSQRLLSEYGKD